jgi:hypothetical protein
MRRFQSEDETEQKKHRQSVEDLSEFLDIPWDLILAIYERELALMKQRARVRDYLPILVSRRVKNLLLR